MTLLRPLLLSLSPKAAARTGTGQLRTLHSSRLVTAQAQAPAPAPLTLHSASTLIRPRAASSASTSASASASASASPPALHSPTGQTKDRAPLADNNDTIRPDDFLFWPTFFTGPESEALLRMALWKLDRVDSTRRRRGRGKRAGSGSGSGSEAGGDTLQSLFEGEYGFEEGHYDSVIHQYRETLLSSLPPSPSSALTQALTRLYALLPNPDPAPAQTELPPKGTITHLLHLSPEGEILPHVDNLEASGKIICGVSLGGERTLRLGHKDGAGGWDVRLPSGSVYLQRDTIRYGYAHSILPYSDDGSVWDGERLVKGHRLSIMIRDAPTRPAQL